VGRLVLEFRNTLHLSAAYSVSVAVAGTELKAEMESWSYIYIWEFEFSCCAAGVPFGRVILRRFLPGPSATYPPKWQRKAAGKEKSWHPHHGKINVHNEMVTFRAKIGKVIALLRFYLVLHAIITILILDRDRGN
jgi:hypothetical protein